MPGPDVNRGRAATILAGAAIRLRSLYASAMALAVLAAPNAERADCGIAADRYTAAVAEVVNALRAYGRCVALSDQRDDCAAEMQALDDAHDDFADAVADTKTCR